MDEATNPRLAHIRTYPIKSLDPVVRKRVTIGERGALRGDREFAIRNADGEYVNGKRTAKIHRLRAAFDEEVSEVTLRIENTEREGTFPLHGDRTALETWLADFFGYPVTVDHELQGGFPDDTSASGPTVISTGTLREVASWFPGIGVEGTRRRLRANVEIEGVPPFWEDRLYADPGRVVAFSIGDAVIEGVNPCRRCVVPSRDPDTGEEYEDFTRTFTRRRAETLPAWANESRFDTYFRLMVNTQVPESTWGSEIAVGDGVRVLGERALDAA